MNETGTTGPPNVEETKEILQGILALRQKGLSAKEVLGVWNLLVPGFNIVSFSYKSRLLFIVGYVSQEYLDDMIEEISTMIEKESHYLLVLNSEVRCLAFSANRLFVKAIFIGILTLFTTILGAVATAFGYPVVTNIIDEVMRMLPPT